MSTLKIEEKVAVKASPDRVFKFLIDPEQVVSCLPGAGYDGKEDDKTFLGHVKVKVGPVTSNFKGKARMEEIDEAARRVQIVGEGKDPAGGNSARMTMVGRVEPVDGGAELRVEADVEVSGRLVTFGRGMIQSVSAQLFKQFSARIREALETPDSAEPPAPTPTATAPIADTATATATDSATAKSTALAPPPSPTPPVTARKKDDEALNALPLLFRALWDSLLRFFRRIFRSRTA
jgi:uncharacterized protein